MYAVIATEPGEADVLQWQEVPDPVVGPEEILIDVTATSVNRADLLQRRGFYPPPPGTSDIIGLECSGTIRTIGSDVTNSRFSVGDEVCALLSGGGYAEQVSVPAGQVMHRPSSVDLVTAASLPEIAATVWSNLRGVARMHAGDVVVIHGGAGGIGSHAIQVAKAMGAIVVVTAGSPEKLDRCRALGADVAINYRTENFTEAVMAITHDYGADIVLDNMGAKYLQPNVDALAADGRIVVIGLQGGVKGELDLAQLLSKRGTIHATSLRARPEREKAQICGELEVTVWPMLDNGQVVPVIDSVMPITDVVAAHQRMEAGQNVGKIVLTMP